MPRPRTIKDLNIVLYKRDPARIKTIVEVANMLNDWQGAMNPNYLLGDLLLFKLNILSSKCRPRKVKRTDNK